MHSRSDSLKERQKQADRRTETSRQTVTLLERSCVDFFLPLRRDRRRRLAASVHVFPHGMVTAATGPRIVNDDPAVTPPPVVSGRRRPLAVLRQISHGDTTTEPSSSIRPAVE